MVLIVLEKVPWVLRNVLFYGSENMLLGTEGNM